MRYAKMPSNSESRDTFALNAENPLAAVGGALIAAAPVVAAGASIVASVIETGRVLRSTMGSIKFTTQNAGMASEVVTNNPTRTTTRRFRFVGSGTFVDDTYILTVRMRANCRTIDDVALTMSEGTGGVAGAITRTGSDLEISAMPVLSPPRQMREPHIKYVINGTWNSPTSFEYPVSATLYVYASGAMRMDYTRINANSLNLRSARSYRASSTCTALNSAHRAPTTNLPSPASPRSRPAQTSRPSRAFQGRPSSPTRHDIYFATSATQLSRNANNMLRQWLNAVPQRILQAASTGQVPLYVTGHTSANGSPSTNLRISTQRAEAAARAIRAVLPNADIRAEGRAGQDILGSGRNDPLDRRTTVQIVTRR